MLAIKAQPTAASKSLYRLSSKRPEPLLIWISWLRGLINSHSRSCYRRHANRKRRKAVGPVSHKIGQIPLNERDTCFGNDPFPRAIHYRLAELSYVQEKNLSSQSQFNCAHSTEGNIFQGELSLEQLFFLRPVPGWAHYRTPIENLYICGSATHPGGGIMGANGRIASQVILKQWKKAAAN